MKTSKTDNSIIVALDIGTNKIAAIAGCKTDDAGVEILGVAAVPSEGLKKGVVVNIEKTVNSIKKVVKELEVASDIAVRKVCVGIAGEHIASINCEGAALIEDKKEVTQMDIECAMKAVWATHLPADQQILHVLPRDFKIDDQVGINDPRGMSGYRLSANVHLITGGHHPIKNITRCVNHSGLNVSHIVADQIASSQAVLTDDEKDLGVCLLDIGGGTTDMVVFSKGTPAHTTVIPVGGDHVTSDIAVTLRTPTKDAEEIKIKYGCALTQFVGENENVEIPGVAGRPSSRHRRQALAMIIEPRYEELFELVNQELQQHQKNKYAVTGFVLTGGSSKMEKVIDLAGKVFNAPVRIGRPQRGKLSGMVELVDSPIHATGVGLLQYAIDMANDTQEQNVRLSALKNKWKRFVAWLRDNF